MLKVNGQENPADLFAKHSETATKLDQRITLFACEIGVGRPAAGPQLKKASAQQTSAASPQCGSALGPTTDAGGAGNLLPHLQGRWGGSPIQVRCARA